jgi:hypothetical protein
MKKNEDSLISSNEASPSPSKFLMSSTLSLRLRNVELVDCEYCGLKYKTLEEKNVHQIYYCIGRDLSLDRSILKLRNNQINKKVSINSTITTMNESERSVGDNTSFKFPSSILKTNKLANANDAKVCILFS